MNECRNFAGVQKTFCLDIRGNFPSDAKGKEKQIFMGWSVENNFSPSSLLFFL